MHRLIFAAALAVPAFAAAPLLLATPAHAQMESSTTQTTMPNGNVRTTTRTTTPDGSSATRTVDRPDGTRTVIRRQTDVMGDTRTVRHDRGSNMVTVCHSRWVDGHRVRRCHDRARR